jgi:hypothetical protein
MQSPPTRTNKLVRVAVRYGRGSPAHMSATRQADFASRAAVLTAEVNLNDGLARQRSPVDIVDLAYCPSRLGIQKDCVDPCY